MPLTAVRSLPKPRPRRRWLELWKRWSFTCPLRRGTVISPARWAPWSTLCAAWNKWKVKSSNLSLRFFCFGRHCWYWWIYSRRRSKLFFFSFFFFLLIENVPSVNKNPSLFLPANEEYYQLLMINEGQPPGLGVSSYTIEEIDSITSEYTLKNNVSHLYAPLPTRGMSGCILIFFFFPPLGRTPLQWPCPSARGGSCTFPTRPRPYSTAKETPSPTASLWSFWSRRMSASSPPLPHPTGCTPGARPPEQVERNACRHAQNCPVKARIPKTNRYRW